MKARADLVVTNAAVYTVDPARPRAQAVAVCGNRIAFVGSAAGAQAWRGPHTEVVDAGGRTLLPGFIDSHFHLLWGSLKLAKLQLDTAHSLEEIGAHVRAYAAAHPDKEWIEGVQLLYSAIPRERPLDRHFLDALVPDRPVFLTAFDAHTAWANTEALRRGGLLAGAACPPATRSSWTRPRAWPPASCASRPRSTPSASSCPSPTQPGSGRC